MIKVRDAKERDLITCDKLSKIPELKTPDGDYPDARYLRSFLNKGLFLVAEKSNKIVGYIAGEIVNGNIAYLNCLVVKNEFRSKRIGSRLLKEFNHIIKKLKINLIFFFAPKDNSKTIRFYEKNGYSKGKEYYFFKKKCQ